MDNPKSLQGSIDEDLKPTNANRFHSFWPGALMAAGGILLILGAPVLIWVFHGQLADLGPHVLVNLWYGAGGLALLYFTAGLPLGAILLATGGARLFPAAESPRRVLVPLLGIQLIYFIYHAIAVFRYTSVPFMLFAFTGCLFIVLFLALAWVWARKRPGLEPERRRVVDLQLGGALSFFTAAWQTYGLAGEPGFALYPEVVQKIANQSFIAGQALAIEVFFALGFVFLLLTMWAGRSQNDVASKQDKAT